MDGRPAAAATASDAAAAAAAVVAGMPGNNYTYTRTSDGMGERTVCTVRKGQTNRRRANPEVEEKS